VIRVLTEVAERYPQYGCKKFFQAIRRQAHAHASSTEPEGSRSNALVFGRRFRTFNVADDFNREALVIEIDLNIPAQRMVRILDRIVANRGYSLKILNEVLEITERWLNEYTS